MHHTKKLLLVAIACLLLAFMLAHPFGRAIILFLLPLGSGIDDLIEIVALVIGVVALVFYFARRKSNLE